eukprot:TRINITY_DN67240_c0_g1_i1.p1 TRINITY_DN67240_c0_g1~~TRINITY_DN67240_c0_g1_i1.p1  ORF type:complete len:281 (-),score=37.69 TRINITY_DN67240_c0_g1_i1:155-997(-)
MATAVSIALDAVAAFNALNPELLNYAGRLSDNFVAVDCARDADVLPGCLKFVGGAIDAEDFAPERWDDAFLFHDGEATAALDAIFRIRGVKRVHMTDKCAFMKLFPWWKEAGPVNELKVQLPSAVWCDSDLLGLFLASRRAVQCHDTIKNLRITSVVDLSTRGGNVASVSEANYLRIQVDDDPAEAEKLLSYIPLALEFVASRLKSGERVVVHCDKGQSRSASVILAWLMMTLDCDYEMALQTLLKHRPIVKPNDGFAAALRAVDGETVASWKCHCDKVR